MDKVAIDLGILQIYWYSVCIFLGVLVGSTVVYLEAKKRKIDPDFIINLIFNVVIFGIIGARLYYVAFNLDYYGENPIEILEIWNGGLAIHGGILFGLAYLVYSCRKNKIEVLKILDIAVVGVIIGQAIGRWGNFCNQEAYGMVTTAAKLKSTGVPEFVINGMYIMGEYREPTFFYESMWNLFGFVALIIIRKYPYLKKGQLSGFYLMWYSSARFIIEGKRADSLMLGNIKVAQVISVILMIVGFILFIYYKRIKRVDSFSELYKDEDKKEEKEKQLFIKPEKPTQTQG